MFSMESFNNLSRKWMNNKILIADLQLIVSAMAFGVGFAGQKEAQLEGMAPLFFNALRYGLSALFLLTLVPIISTRIREKDDREVLVNAVQIQDKGASTALVIGSLGSLSQDKSAAVGLLGGVSVTSNNEVSFIERYMSTVNDGAKVWILGIALASLNFGGSALQQIGIKHISSSESAFLTGFYIVFTPLLQTLVPSLTPTSKPKWNTWVAVCISMIGLFVISGSSFSNIRLAHGEILTLVSAIFWTLFIILTDNATNMVDSIQLTVVNLGFTGLFSLIASYIFEYSDWSIEHIISSWKIIFFLGAIECVGFTLGALGQTYAPAHHASIIYGSEPVWATLGGYLLVNEEITFGELVGCALMIASTVITKIDWRRTKIPSA